jgi:hypothetical protein
MINMKSMMGSLFHWGNQGDVAADCCIQFVMSADGWNGGLSRFKKTTENQDRIRVTTLRLGPRQRDHY